MNIISAEKEVARLDGFLYGIASMNGGIRSYSAYAYIIKPKEGASFEQSLKDFYVWNPDMAFSDAQHLSDGLRDLEIGIGALLVRDVSYPIDNKLVDLRAYLSFRVMDMISLIRDGAPVVDVVKLTSARKPSASECVYFCIKTEDFLIVLQFNNDAPYIKSLAGG
ncbi:MULTISPECIES: hypothetical protein [Lysobacter]|uniref:hypothetical protein n=1 Tax=Lysobacter TaxID=68 RepID=UPI001F4459E2|nr:MULTISPECIES: hypothetical protein [Lysobacter]UJB18448.1 hypothetical protein L1A79_19255 [Lysobacter capsici]UJQ27828.1 hypothetical protein L2D09_20630 [Lysobacter gummosus]